LVTQVEHRLQVALEDAVSFKLMNELANILRKHDNLEISVSLYKKALLSLKQRFKNTYLQQRDTSRILINIASTEYMRNNHSEAQRYYEHALTVLRQQDASDSTRWTESAKVYVSLATIAKQQKDKITAQEMYSKAIVSNSSGIICDL
jgi:tetratricopeptide (TPR) repeat protein